MCNVIAASVLCCGFGAVEVLGVAKLDWACAPDAAGVCEDA